MVEDARRYKSQDDENREKAQARKALNEYAYNVRDALRERNVRCKLTTADRKKVIQAVEQLIITSLVCKNFVFSEVVHEVCSA
ncbi:Allergen [Nymphaea thermarum]|nr:Allergen [Nymphaea thermarum]